MLHCWRPGFANIGKACVSYLQCGELAYLQMMMCEEVLRDRKDHGQEMEITYKEPLPDIDRGKAVEILKNFFGNFIRESIPEVEFVILITKKSFWSYQVLKDELGEIKNKNGQKIQFLSDRFFQKIVDFGSYNNKKIAIIDDTMNTGSAIREFYKLMRKQCDKSKIIPIICFLNDNYIPKEWKKDQYDRDFHKDLIVMHKVRPALIGKMCIFETITFHEQLIPYIVDLPVLEWKDQNGCWQRKFKFSTEAFEKLCAGNIFWEFHRCDYRLIPGIEIEAGYFSFANPLLQMKFGSFLSEIVIKVQYQKTETEVEAVFTPFAMMRSVKAEELEWCFEILFADTKYRIARPSEEEVKLNYYTALYRAVVYCLSFYGGLKFTGYLNVSSPIRLHNEKQFTDEFYQSIHKIFDISSEKEFNETGFLRRVILLPEFTVVESQEKTNFADREKRIVDYSEDDWYAFLYERIIYAKRNFHERRHLTCEEFEQSMANRVGAHGDDREQALATRLQLEALNKSILSNYLFFDERRRVVYRGYRYGENSELLLPYDARLFYQAISTYYDIVRTEGYFRALTFFYINFREFLERNGWFGYLITERQFQFFARYFGSLPEKDLECQIDNKRYLLEENIGGQEDRFMRSVLEETGEFVSNLMLRDENMIGV